MKSRILIIALSLIFVFAVLPCSAEKPWGGKQDGDVCRYEFGTKNTDGGNLNLCWDMVSDTCYSADDMWSVELYGLVSYAYGPTPTMVLGEEYSYDYGTSNRCFSKSLDEIKADIAADLPAELISFSFGTISAKVKGLDPKKTKGTSPWETSNKKRQNNLFCSEPFAFGSLNWTAPPPR